MSDKTNDQDQQTLLGIAFADQALLSAHIVMFAAKTGNPQETIELLHEITDEISNRYHLTGLAKDTMTMRINKTISMASAIIGNKITPADTSDKH